MAPPLIRAVIALTALLAAIPASADTQWSRFPAMGTAVEIGVRHADPGRRRAALDAARIVIERHGREWYPWREGTELNRINRAIAAGKPAPASAALIAVLEEAVYLSCLSGGRFDPAIGGLVEHWGFHRPPPYTDPPPTAAEIRRWLDAEPSADDLRLQPGTVASGNPAVRLDLGGIAKGAILDRALAVIREQGVEHALINAGGDLAVIGTAAGRPWRAAIRDPRAQAGAGPLATIELRPGEALFTSGDYERFREIEDGERVGHVLDPRTGRPARRAIQVSVIARRGTVADAAATALMVAGREDWPRVAARMNVRNVLWIGEGSEPQANPALASRLDTGDRRLEGTATDRPAVEPGDCQRPVSAPQG